MFTVTTPIDTLVLKLIKAKSGKRGPSLWNQMKFTLIFTVIPHSLYKSLSGFRWTRLSHFFCQGCSYVSVYEAMYLCVCLCVLHCSHSDDSDQKACLSVGVWFLRLARSTQPCQFSFSGCLLLVCHWTCCVTLIKDLKGQEAFRERSAAGSGRNCVAPWGNPRGWISSRRLIFREK